jgi:hypothetical protein
MYRFARRLPLLVALTLAASGCRGDDGSDTPTDPGGPSSSTETFTGILTLNGAATHRFTVAATGAMSAQLASLQPDSAKPVGFSLGSWSNGVCAVSPGLYNDVAIQGSTIVGETQTVGEFCVRIYDAAGSTVDPQTYIIEVTHL